MDLKSLAWLTIALAIPVSLRHGLQKFRQYLFKKETALMDWPLLGKPRAEKDKIPGTAVICGGSLAGLLAARVCHDHFERVVIVEPEAWLCTEDGIKVESWTQTNKRARVMQYTSLHGNLAPITDGLLRLFPNLEAECHKSGIKLVPADFKLALGGHKFLVPHDEFGGSLPRTAQAGRQGTETLIRRLTFNSKEYPNISQISGTVTRVGIDSINSKFLKTVQIQTAAGPKEIDAALVIDCTGPGRGGQEWIHHAGFVDTKVLDKLTVTYDPRVRYSSFRFHITEELAAKVPEYEKENATGGLFIYKGDPSVSPTYCGAMKVEGDFVALTCGAWGKNSEELPDNVEGVREFLKSDKSATAIPKWIWNFLDICEEAESTVLFSKVRVPPSFWVHFESSSDLPANWIASGDSVSRVNPVFGQGGTKAMMGAVSLNNVLHGLCGDKSIPQDFSQRFFRIQADKLAPLWAGNKMVDYSYKTTIPEEGETLETGSIIRWYLRKLEMMSDKDKQIGAMYWRTLHSYGTSIDALNPIFIGKVLMNMVFGH